MGEPGEDFRRFVEELKAQGPNNSVDLLLRHMEPEVADRLRLCSIPHQFDPEILRVLSPELDADTARDSCEEFARLSIVIPGQGELALHDQPRRYLFSRWLSDPGRSRFRSASARLAKHFEERLSAAGGESREFLECEQVFHLIGADQAKGMDEFERLFRRKRQGLRLATCGGLIKLVHEYDPILSPEDVSRLQYQEGKLAADRRDWVQAEKHFTEVLAMPSTPPPLKVKSNNRLGMLYKEQRKWAKAIKQFEVALQLAEAEPAFQGEIPSIMLNLGATLRDSGEMAEAERYFHESIKIAGRADNSSTMAEAYNGLGTLHRRRGDIPDGISNYKKSLEYLGEDPFRPAQVYNNLGDAYAAMNDWNTSEQYYQRSLAIKCRADDIHGQATSLHNLISVHMNLGMREQALADAEEAIVLFDRIRDHYGKGLVLRDMGRLHRRSGNIDQSRQAFLAAIASFEQCKEDQQVKATRNELD